MFLVFNKMYVNKHKPCKVRNKNMVTEGIKQHVNDMRHEYMFKWDNKQLTYFNFVLDH